MSPAENGCMIGAGEQAADGLVVVTVTESVVPALTGREGCTYVSPAQPREQAMTLVRLLLGCATDPDRERERWAAPIAGGRRVVVLRKERE
jgi:hypothetical protein